MLSEEDLLSTIAKLRMHLRAPGQRSPHKPFLLLIALARLQEGKERLMLFSDIEEQLDELLTEFYPPRKDATTTSNEPFCRLRGDGIWELSTQANISLPTLSTKTELKNFRRRKRVVPLPTILTKADLKKHKVKGGFSPDVYSLLKNNQQLVEKAATSLLNQHFPETIHQDILDIVGLEIDYPDTAEMRQKHRRDSQFRQKILQIYQYRCAVCSFDVRMGLHPLALEAAHIKWFSEGGDDIESNGLALCTLHHKLFDRGAFSVSKSDTIIVSDKISGYAGLKEWLLNFHDKALNAPNYTQHKPNAECTQWHREEVFRGREEM